MSSAPTGWTWSWVTSRPTDGPRPTRCSPDWRSSRGSHSSTAAPRSRSSTSTARSRRRPAIMLVDELAHTNAPGSRHAKRWQDVVELLDAGIDVYTTVNVQHVESLNDVVAKITGVVMRETVPDSVFEQADEVELIDLPPDDLLQRFREGKVYLPGQAQEALRELLPQGQPDRAARAGAAPDRRARRRADARLPARARHRSDLAHRRAHSRLRRPQPHVDAAGARRPSVWPISSAPSGSPPTSRRRPSSACRRRRGTASSRRCGWPSSSAPRPSG